MTQLTDRPPQPPEPPPPNPTAFFATENPDNIDAIAGMGMRAALHAVFHHYATADEFEGSKDHDTELARMCSATGLSLTEVRGAVYAYRSLKDLPMLRALQEATHRLDLRRLKAIDRAISVLGDTPDPEVFALLDALLVTLFTPTKPNQALPGANTITTRLNKAIGDMDSSVAFDQKKREKREKGRTLLPGACEVTFHDGYYHGSSGMTMTADHATSAAVKAFIGTTAKEHGITDDEATLLLLTGKISPSANARVYGYAPKNSDGTIDESASVFIPGHGFTTATGTEQFHSFNPKLVDMDAAATRSIDGYVPPADIAAFVRGRDGTCIYPGCDRTAWECQLDHRIAYGLGGATTANNLYCLCQKHHNVKTDRRAFYLVDPTTGDVVWLFSDGTYALADRNGFINSQVTETTPRWKQTIDDVERLKRTRSRFFAKCHRVLDVFEENFDYEECLKSLSALEREYGMEFPFHPVPFPEEPEVDY